MIRIYVHGRPQGQDIWCKSPAATDKFYLNPFLDSRIGEDMNAVMQVDMWQQNAYYTYIHRRNVMEKGNRPSAYFAITICFEKQYCTQVATLYELLETIYKQLCLNSIIEKVSDQERFLVAQFKEKETVLVQITNVILQNIEKYMSGSLEAIESKQQDTTATSIKSYSTVDVDSPQFFTDCASHRVLIAPTFMTKDRLPQELQQKIVAIEAQKAELLKDRNRWQSDAEHSHDEVANLTRKQRELQEQISRLESQMNSVKDEVRREYQSQIKQLRDETETTKMQLGSLNKQLSQERNAKSELNNQIESYKKAVRKRDDEVQRLQQLLKQRQHNDPIPDDPTNPTDPTDPTEITSILNSLIAPFRRMAGRFPFLWSKVAAALAAVNTALLIAVIVILVGNAKTRNVDILNDCTEQVQDTTIVQPTDSTTTPLDVQP